jgi:DNA-directed RNA polymerase alpha subunit
MEYYNNKALNIIIKNQKATNENIVTLNNNQKNHTNLIFKSIEFNRSLIYDLQEENKLLKKNLKKIKSVFNLNKKVKQKNINIKDKVFIDTLKKPIHFLEIHKQPRYGVMNNCGSYNTIADLVKSSKQEILSIRYVGKNTYSSIVEKLAKHNLYIGMDISKYEPYL